MHNILSIIDLKLSPAEQQLTAVAGRGQFIWCPVHDRLAELMNAVVHGGSCGVAVGDRRAGKTQSLQTITNHMIESGAFADTSRSPVLISAAPRSSVPTAILRRMASIAGLAEPMEKSVSELLNRTAVAMGTNGIQLVCVDEAHRLVPEAIDLLAALPAAARSTGHRLGVMLVGRRPLLDHLHRWQQQKR